MPCPGAMDLLKCTRVSDVLCGSEDGCDLQHNSRSLVKLNKESSLFGNFRTTTRLDTGDTLVGALFEATHTRPGHVPPSVLVNSALVHLSKIFSPDGLEIPFCGVIL